MHKISTLTCEVFVSSFESVIQSFNVLMNDVVNLERDDYVLASNTIKEMLHQYSPFKDNPVDCVIWVKSREVFSNDYNPNSVAPPEMELLRHSIMEDGYTQPIVTWPHDGRFEVIDGFHRNRVGKECEEVSQRVHGYLPVVKIRKSQQDKERQDCLNY